MEEPVTIVDRDVLKILSADTRMDILKILSEGGRTPSFISKKLNKTDATIVEHLNALVKAGLVKKIEQPGRKWVFYTLTEKGQGIVSSKSRRLIIVLSASLVGLVVGSTGVINNIFPSYTGTAFSRTLPAAETQVSTATGTALAQASPILFYGSIALTMLSLVGITYFFYRRYHEQ